jgi:hypothetical protein
LKRSHRIVLASLALTGLLLAACGDSKSNKADTGGSTTTGAAVNTASDQGVTETEIKVAIVSADLTALVKGGLIKGVPDNATELNAKRASAPFDTANAAGGVNGRKFKYESVTWDPVDPKSFDVACQKIADGKFFMAFNVGGGYNPDKIPCITDAGTFFFGIDAASLQNFADSKGKLITMAPPAEVEAQAGIDALLKTGVIAKDAKIGVLRGNTTSQTGSYDRIKKALDAGGYKIAYADAINTATQTGGAIAKEVQLSVAKFVAAGITNVIVTLPFTNATSFYPEADKSGFKPKYSMIEVGSGGCTTFTGSQGPAVFEGGTCTTHWDNFRYDDKGTLKADNPTETDCRKQYETIYGFKTNPGVKYGGALDSDGTTYIKEDQAYFDCSLMNGVVLPSIKAAGANLTKKSMFDAAAKLTSFEVAGMSNSKGSLGPDKPFVATAVHSIVFRAAAKTKGADGKWGPCPSSANCWQVITPDTWTPLATTLNG